MEPLSLIIKSNGKRQSEYFVRLKLFKSIIAACLSVRTPEGQAELTANKVCNDVEKWLEKHPEVTSNDIRRTAAKYLKKYQPEAAYLYEQRQITI